MITACKSSGSHTANCNHWLTTTVLLDDRVVATMASVRASRSPTVDARTKSNLCNRSEYPFSLSSVAAPSSSSYRSENSKNLVFLPRKRFDVSIRAG